MTLYELNAVFWGCGLTVCKLHITCEYWCGGGGKLRILGKLWKFGGRGPKPPLPLSNQNFLDCTLIEIK